MAPLCLRLREQVGRKAIRYTTQCKQDAATVVFYGSPVIDVNLKAQFPKPLLDKFQIALDQANLLMMCMYMMVLDILFGRIWNKLREGNNHKLMLMNNVYPFLGNTLVEMILKCKIHKLYFYAANISNNSFIKWIRVV